MTGKTQLRYPFLLRAGCALLTVLLVPCARGAAALGREGVSTTCLGCHAGQDTTLAGTTHWPSGVPHDGKEARVACNDCHAGDPKHYEEDPQANPMPVPSKMGALAEAKLCSTCHLNAHQQNMLERNVHAANDLNCSTCHRVHGSTHASLLRKTEPALCLDCHARVAGDFAKPYRHPVNEGVIRCTECHLTLDETRQALSQNGTNVCMKCHGEFEGPFLYEHQATLDFSTDEGGCLSCHEPHGSHLPRMLKQPFEPPHYALCTQCHSVPRHNSNAKHGTAWAGMPCNDCHTDIHGSYDNRLFVNESLKSQGCFKAGCHHLQDD
jgi:DmsE family decaheme c-type cytochrome